MPTLSDTDRKEILDNEVRDWSHSGYQVLARSDFAVQLKKPRKPMLVPIVAWMICCAVLLLVTDPIVDGVIFTVGLILILALQFGQREPLLYLTVTPDGELLRE